MLKGKYFPVESDGKFTLVLFQPAYSTLVCSDNAYIRNKVTGENCGQEVILCKHINNIDGTINENPKVDDDVYEVVPL